MIRFSSGCPCWSLIYLERLSQWPLKGRIEISAINIKAQQNPLGHPIYATTLLLRALWIRSLYKKDQAQHMHDFTINNKLNQKSVICINKYMKLKERYKEINLKRHLLTKACLNCSVFSLVWTKARSLIF